MISYTASQIAERVQGELLGEGSTLLTGFSSADHARAGDLTFADKEEYFVAAEASAAKTTTSRTRIAMSP